MTDVLFKPFKSQQTFIERCFDSKYKYLLYGGGIRSGKTFVSLALMIVLCRLYPKSRWAIIRKDLQVLKRNTIPSFYKVLPSNFVESFNQSDFVCKFKNGSEILFMGENYDKDKELNRFRGLEVNGFLLEEVNELHEETFNKCIERAGSWIIDNMPPPKIMCTTNPTQNWVKTKFYDPFMNGTLLPPFYFQPALIFDNPFIPQEYLESLKSLPDAIYRVFVEGKWEGSDEPGQLISWEDMYAARESIDSLDSEQSLGVDVAGHGKDKTVFLRLKGNNIVETLTYDDTAVDEVANRTTGLMLAHGISSQNVCVDGAGLGAGVVDIMNTKKLYPVNFIGGSASMRDNTAFNYKNLRAQAYWHLRGAFSDKLIGGATNDRLLSDLASVRYTIEGDKQIKIESKDETKKRIGRSPDYADALSYAWWARIHHSIVPAPGLFVF